jgi:hypothetical protein
MGFEKGVGVGAGRGRRVNPVVVDTYRYYTFSERDRCQSLQEIIARFGSELGELDGKEGSVIDRGVAQVITGEWGCMLGGNTWGRVKPEGRGGLVREFGLAQNRKWQQRAGGSDFWTYKMDWMDGISSNRRRGGMWYRLLFLSYRLMESEVGRRLLK